MSHYLDYHGLVLYDDQSKIRTSKYYYNKDEVDNLLAGIETNILWKDAVATYNDIATTYPTPAEGWTVTVLDTNETYRYDGDEWVKISAGTYPKATATNDGLMPKESYAKLEGLGNASEKNYTITVDQSANLPTAQAVQTYVGAAIMQLNNSLEEEISTKVGIEDVGDASARDYTDSISEEKEKIEVKGEWYSDDVSNSFLLKGTGVDDGIDMSFFEDLNNYIVHFNLLNYSTPVNVSLHVYGTKTDPITSEVTPIDIRYTEGAVLSIDDVPDEYLAGTDSAELEIVIPDYEEATVKDVNFLVYPVFHDDNENEDIFMVNSTVYEGGAIIHQEYDSDLNDHVLMGTYGLYTDSDLPTSSAVSSLVRTVTQALQTVLESEIDVVEAKIDAYSEATDADIEALFEDNDDSGVSDEDIENLFG